MLPPRNQSSKESRMAHTIRLIRSAAVLAVTVILTALAPPAAAQQPAQNGEHSTLRGAFTLEQAARGETVFRDRCGNCHPTSDFSGAVFQTRWDGGPLLALVEQIRTNMPLDNPGGLSATEYAAIVAYILKLNSYPPGDTEVPVDDAVLRQIRFERVPPKP
jgi:mono/diheme cytochrome c family protein